MYLSAPPPGSVTVTVTVSAHLLGNGAQCFQDVLGQLGGIRVSELGVGHDGVLDEVDTNLVGRAGQCFRSHLNFPFQYLAQAAREARQQLTCRPVLPPPSTWRVPRRDRSTEEPRVRRFGGD